MSYEAVYVLTVLFWATVGGVIGWCCRGLAPDREYRRCRMKVVECRWVDIHSGNFQESALWAGPQKLAEVWVQPAQGYGQRSHMNAETGRWHCFVLESGKATLAEGKRAVEQYLGVQETERAE
jgi:uncharacterized cysteine cluster protein YcgN (CxxCxxCC family)